MCIYIFYTYICACGHACTYLACICIYIYTIHICSCSYIPLAQVREDASVGGHADLQSVVLAEPAQANAPLPVQAGQALQPSTEIVLASNAGSPSSVPPAQQTPSPTTPASGPPTPSSSKESLPTPPPTMGPGKQMGSPLATPSPKQAVEQISRDAAKKRLSRLFAPRVDGSYAVDAEVAKLWKDPKEQTALIDEFIALGYCKARLDGPYILLNVTNPEPFIKPA